MSAKKPVSYTHLDVYKRQDEDIITRVELFGDEVERLSLLNELTGEVLEQQQSVMLFPTSHYVTSAERLEKAMESIRQELEERVAWFEGRGKLLEAQRLRQRTEYDLEMMQEVGYCQGIENYSRHLDGRRAGQTPNTLLDLSLIHI